jgi:NAD+ synthase (glutamine-hydrolysing)
MGKTARKHSAPDSIRIALAQLNLRVGDVDGNTARILGTAAHARDELGADLILFPELAICGYPPEDLLHHAGMRKRVAQALERVRGEVRGIDVVVGYPEYVEGDIYNAAALFRDGVVVANYRKHRLPNYRVFDERRYFQPGDAPAVVDIKGLPAALLICEDIWDTGPMSAAAAAGAKLALIINGSPYQLDYQARREEVLHRRIAETRMPAVYVNLIGGQDELIFDGNSMVMNAAGEVVGRALPFVEDVFVTEIALDDGVPQPVPGPVAPSLSAEESVYSALLLGVRDYVDKHEFPGVVIGLSGGIDSGLTLAIAVDALGRERVRTIMMPSPYTSAASLEDAARQAELLGVRYDVISIESMMKATLQALSGVFEGLAADTTEENIQARCRGILLMAISNKTGWMLLTTGNKSEMAVGYATLYGDMAGGFAPIKDCSKTMVRRLARYRNSLSAVIPERVLTRPPSAELRPDQKDSDTLPPYELLDPILEAFIEDDCSVDEIVARGYDRALVGKVLGMVKRNEYKRRQAPPGIRISGRAFGRDWRYPITSGFQAR